MRGPREVLNELKWTTGLAGVEVTYVHRGAPGDVRVVRAEDVLALGTSFFDIAAPRGRSGSIPYHRVVRIARGGGETLWERKRD